jgi:hypothetical protein
MLISEKKSFVFIHNPKCAGTSVRSALLKYETTGDLFWQNSEWNERPINKAHLPLTVFRDLYPRHFQLFSTYLVFMFVRNPYDRTVSAFNESHKKMVPTKEDPAFEAAYGRALNGFVQSMSHDAFRIVLHKFRNCPRQVDLCYIGHKRMVDVVMKLEEWPRCLDKLAIHKPEIAEVIRNSSRRNANPVVRQPRSYLTPESIAKINEVYSEDFDVFDYERIIPA